MRRLRAEDCVECVKARGLLGGAMQSTSGSVEAGALISLLHVPLKKPGLGIWDDAMPLVSPYQANPLSHEPLRYVISRVVDFDALKSPGAPALHVNAVNVRTGQSRVFGPQELSAQALLASACAPLMFQAVHVDGEAYWDGSYGANPMLWPLYDGVAECDIFMIELTPLFRPEVPTTAKNILNRINEIASIHGLVSEMRAVDLLNRQSGKESIRMHVLRMPDTIGEGEVGPSTKRTVGAMLFDSLRRKGYEACGRWLAAHREGLGKCSTISIENRYLLPHRHARIATEDLPAS